MAHHLKSKSFTIIDFDIERMQSRVTVKTAGSQYEALQIYLDLQGNGHFRHEGDYKSIGGGVWALTVPRQGRVYYVSARD